jgi:uncharacterized protein (DUF58 family)
MPGRPQGLPRLTPPAWRLIFVAFGLLGAAVNTGNNLIYLLFSLLVASFPVSVGLARLNLRRLHLDLRAPSAPRVGSPFTLDVEITAARSWPALRSIEVTIFTDQGEYGPILVERIAPQSGTRVTFVSRGARRGPLKIVKAVVRSTFPFGLVRGECRFDRADELLVLPAADRSAARDAQLLLTPGGRTLSPRVAGTEYAGLRRGAVEDDARKVDWKVTARRGVTIVRETAGESCRETRLNVETRRGGEPRQARDRFEEHVSRIAGHAQHALEGGGVVHLTLDGAASISYSGRTGLLHLLRRLARIAPTSLDGSPLPHPQSDSVASRERPDLRGSPAGRSHRISAAVALAISAAALWIGGGLGPLLFGTVIGSLVVTSVFGRFVVRERSIASHLWKASAFLILGAYIVDVVAVRHDLLAASLSLTVFITLFAIFNARRVEDDRQLLMVSFLHIVLASALTTEVALALPLLGWLLATTHALMAWTAMPRIDQRWQRSIVDTRAAVARYPAPALGAATAMLATGAVIFVIVPHLGTGAFRPELFRGTSITGFSETTTLGDIGRIKLDHSKVMELDVGGVAKNFDLRWRGLTLNDFNGRTWTRTYRDYERLAADDEGRFFPSGGWRSASRANGEHGPLLTQNIRLEPGVNSVVFSAAQPRIVSSREFRFLDEDGFGNLNLRARPGRRLSYTVASELPPRDPDILRRAVGDDPEQVRANNLGSGVHDPRVGQLARDITAGTETRYDAANAIENWLSSNLIYSLDVDDRGSEEPLSRFLFDGMHGHCEYFATAMAVLAREAGIPSRFVAGYLRGEKSRFGDRYVVRQSDAHSWVEIYFPEIGWVPFDPTPPAGRGVSEARGPLALLSYLYSSVTRLWDDYLVGIDLDDQARGFLVVTGTIAATTATLRAALDSFVSNSPSYVGLLIVSSLVLVAAAVLAWRRRQSRKMRRKDWTDDVRAPAFYQNVLEFLARQGLSRRAGETPAELATRAEPVLTRHAADRLREVTRLYYRVRFDSSTDAREVHRIARALLGDIQNGLLAR